MFLCWDIGDIPAAADMTVWRDRAADAGGVEFLAGVPGLAAFTKCFGMPNVAPPKLGLETAGLDIRCWRPEVLFLLEIRMRQSCEKGRFQKYALFICQLPTWIESLESQDRDMEQLADSDPPRETYLVRHERDGPIPAEFRGIAKPLAKALTTATVCATNGLYGLYSDL